MKCLSGVNLCALIK